MNLQLLCFVSEMIHDVIYSIISAWQTYNALFAVRCILKYLIEIVGEEQMLNHIEAPQTANEALPSYRLAYFIEALIELITDVPLW